MELGTIRDPLGQHVREGAIPGIMFRRAVRSDVASIHDLIKRAYSHYVPLLGYAPGPMRRDYDVQLRENPVWLAMSGNTLAALLELIVEPDCVVVEDLAVAPESQGKRIGSWFMAFAEDVARANGIKVMRTYTNQKMDRNIAIYLHLGYRETHRTVTEDIPRVFLEKALRQL